MLKNLQQTRSVNEYIRVFKSIVLELGGRAPDGDDLVYAYIDRLRMCQLKYCFKDFFLLF